MTPEPNEEKRMWEWFDVELKIQDRILGGLPKDPALIEGFLKGKGVPESEVKAKAAEIAEEIDVAEELSPDRMWTGFKRDDNGIYIETRQIKAMCKEACGESEMWRDVRGLKSRLGGAMFPKGEGGPDKTRIYFYRDGERITEADGYEESVGHVNSPKGKVSILKRKDYAEGVTVSFQIKVGGKTITKKILQNLFEFGQELGLGADRSCEKGKYTVIKFEGIDPPAE